MKNIKKLSITLLVMIILLSSTVFAATVKADKTVMSIVENNICTIKINDDCSFEKKLTKYDLDKKELTIGLKIKNDAKAPVDEPSEIVLLIDNSLSMKEDISTGGTRMNAIINSSKTLATELLKHSTVKISVVSFSTGTDEGTLTDAKLRTPLTNVSSDVLAGIESIATDQGVRTDIEAGLTVASKQFSGTCENKFIVLLTDGVPNISLGTNKIQYSGETATNTKNALKKFADDGINIISMMTGVTTAIDSQTGMTYKELAEEVFGTPENPFVGQFYYITDPEIEETVTEKILSQLVAPDDGVLKNVDIYDYFPQEIVDNFNFEYVTSPNIGTVSASIDLQNNVIVWHIDKLGYGEETTLSYKLTLKENVDSSIIDVVLGTNKKVEITADNIVDSNGNKTVVSSDVTPKVKLTVKKDETITPEKIPQTGAKITFFVIVTIAIILCVVFGIKLYKSNKEDK